MATTFAHELKHELDELAYARPEQQLFNEPVGSFVSALREQQLAKLPHIGQQNPLDVAIGCGGQAAGSLAKDVSGITLLNDTASALAAGSFKPLLNPSDAADATERGAKFAAGNATARQAGRSLGRSLGAKISVRMAGKALTGLGEHAGALGFSIAVYNAGSELADCVQ